MYSMVGDDVGVGKGGNVSSLEAGLNCDLRDSWDRQDGGIFSAVGSPVRVVREPEYYLALFEAIIRGYRHHSSDIPTYNPTQMIGYYGLTWDYTVMKLLNCPISGPKTGFPQTCRGPGCHAFCWLPTVRPHSSLKGRTPKEFADSMPGLS